MPHDATCPFCPPAVEAITFAATRHMRAIVNRAPILPGHSLIVPRRHVASLLDLTDTEACDLMTFSRRVARILAAAFRAPAFDWTIQDGAPAGQTVFHLHLHLIPRREGDLPDPGDWYPRLQAVQNEHLDSAARPQHTPAEMACIAATLRDFTRRLAPDLLPQEDTSCASN